MAAPCQHHHLPAGVLLHVLDCVMRHAVVPDHLRLAEALEGHALDLVSAEGLLYELLVDLVDAALYPGRQLGELLGGEGLEALCEHLVHYLPRYVEADERDPVLPREKEYVLVLVPVHCPVLLVGGLELIFAYPARYPAVQDLLAVAEEHLDADGDVDPGGLEPLYELELGLVVQHLGVHLSNENKVRLPYLFEQLGRLALGPVSGPYYYGRAAPGERKDRYGK